MPLMFPAFMLVVKTAWGNYAVGQAITDPAEIEAVLRDHPDKVSKVPTQPARR